MTTVTTSMETNSISEDKAEQLRVRTCFQYCFLDNTEIFLVISCVKTVAILVCGVIDLPCQFGIVQFSKDSMLPLLD